MSTEDPINNRENFKAGLFYYNPDDDRIFILIPGTASRYRLNYARWPVYIILVPVLVMICYGLFFSGH